MRIFLHLPDNVRLADLHPNPQLNNAVYATCFKTGPVTLMKDRSNGFTPEGLDWVTVRFDIHFRAELTKFGRTSVTPQADGVYRKDDAPPERS